MFTKLQARAHDRYESRLYGLTEISPGEARLLILHSRQVWRREGMWERYYRVRGGKVHANRVCPMLTDATHLTSLWAMSGEAAAAVVVALGPVLCHYCFPDSPMPDAKAVTVACKGSGLRAGVHWAGEGSREVCPVCDASVCVLASGVLRRHP